MMIQFIELTETSFPENLRFQIIASDLFSTSNTAFTGERKRGIASDLFPLAIQHSLGKESVERKSRSEDGTFSTTQRISLSIHGKIRACACAPKLR
jgi:hypothetical protein